MTPTSSPDPRDDQPLRDGTSLIAFLHVLRKAHKALAGPDEARRRFNQVATRGHARKYIEELMPLLLDEREKHRLRRRGGTPHTRP
ncbi:hypothetical protein FAZ69_16570 [Trinickia terrae]|uniref:Uncharacterized protein n=1 Tax=Trinickia terrae TaxID=2571161 RepID=A0A4U1I3Q5_9BURK|nr:hypothetical protein [Trinickia terrae]TKC87881.1 hypothetical protein FAZ69_16570 [Trinickia terrae]